MEVYKGTWRAIVWKKIQDKEQEEWRKRMDSKSKLRTYRVIKSELETEKYLIEGTAQQRRVMVMMRGGTNDLRIETGRYEKLEAKERICIFCESGEVEDERHFLCRCEAWKDEREVVLRRVRKLGVRMTDEEIMFMSGKEEVQREDLEERVKSWRKIVLGGVMMMDRTRKKQWKKMIMGVEEGSSNVRSNSSSSSSSSSGTSSSTSSSSVSSSMSNKGNSSADMLVYAAELLLVGVE
jgi:hypothetical protein